MVTTYLQQDYTASTVVDWYQSATVGDTAAIPVPSCTCMVWLIHQPRNCVHWWFQGERGVTVPLEDAMCRLQLLDKTSSPDACTPRTARPFRRETRCSGGSGPGVWARGGAPYGSAVEAG